LNRSSSSCWCAFSSSSRMLIVSLRFQSKSQIAYRLPAVALFALPSVSDSTMMVYSSVSIPYSSTVSGQHALDDLHCQSASTCYNSVKRRRFSPNGIKYCFCRSPALPLADLAPIHLSHSLTHSPPPLYQQSL
jgi:hypothetical protein